MILGIEITKEKPTSIGYRLDTEIQVDQVEERKYEQGIDIAHKEDWHKLFGLSNIVEFIKDKSSSYFLNVKDDALYLSKNREEVGDFKFPLNLKMPISKVITEGVESSYNKTLGEYMREVLSGNFEVGKCFDYQKDEDFELEIKLTKEKDVMTEYILPDSDLKILHWVPEEEQDLRIDLHVKKERYQFVEQLDFFYTGETFSYLKSQGYEAKFLVSYDEGKTWLQPKTNEKVDISKIYYKEEKEKLDESKYPNLSKEKRVTLLRNQDELKNIWDKAEPVSYMNEDEFLEKIQKQEKTKFGYVLDEKAYMEWIEIVRSSESRSTPSFTNYEIEYTKVKED